MKEQNGYLNLMSFLHLLLMGSGGTLVGEVFKDQPNLALFLCSLALCLGSGVILTSLYLKFLATALKRKK